MSRPRSRSADPAIAAHAISRDAGLWTLNPDDFGDIPDLVLIDSSMVRTW